MEQGATAKAEARDVVLEKRRENGVGRYDVGERFSAAFLRGGRAHREGNSWLEMARPKAIPSGVTRRPRPTDLRP